MLPMRLTGVVTLSGISASTTEPISTGLVRLGERVTEKTGDNCSELPSGGWVLTAGPGVGCLACLGHPATGSGRHERMNAVSGGKLGTAMLWALLNLGGQG